MESSSPPITELLNDEERRVFDAYIGAFASDLPPYNARDILNTMKTASEEKAISRLEYRRLAEYYRYMRVRKPHVERELMETAVKKANKTNQGQHTFMKHYNDSIETQDFLLDWTGDPEAVLAKEYDDITGLEAEIDKVPALFRSEFCAELLSMLKNDDPAIREVLLSRLSAYREGLTEEAFLCIADKLIEESRVDELFWGAHQLGYYNPLLKLLYPDLTIPFRVTSLLQFVSIDLHYQKDPSKIEAINGEMNCWAEDQATLYGAFKFELRCLINDRSRPPSTVYSGDSDFSDMPELEEDEAVEELKPREITVDIQFTDADPAMRQFLLLYVEKHPGNNTIVNFLQGKPEFILNWVYRELQHGAKHHKIPKWLMNNARLELAKKLDAVVPEGYYPFLSWLPSNTSPCFGWKSWLLLSEQPTPITPGRPSLSIPADSPPTSTSVAFATASRTGSAPTPAVAAGAGGECGSGSGAEEVTSSPP